MLKVFLVEDEVIVREGIRDNIDWNSAGLDFCGEASDGELALPMIRQDRREGRIPMDSRSIGKMLERDFA